MLIIRILFTHTVVIVIPLNFRASIVWMTIKYKNIILMKQRKSPIYLRLEKIDIAPNFSSASEAFLHQWWICQPSPLTQVGSILSKTTSSITSTKCHIDSHNLHSLYLKWWRGKMSTSQKFTFLLSKRDYGFWSVAELFVPSTEIHETLYRYVDPNQTLQWVELAFNLRWQFLHFCRNVDINTL